MKNFRQKILVIILFCICILILIVFGLFIVINTIKGKNMYSNINKVSIALLKKDEKNATKDIYGYLGNWDIETGIIKFDDNPSFITPVFDRSRYVEWQRYYYNT